MEILDKHTLNLNQIPTNCLIQTSKRSTSTSFVYRQTTLMDWGLRRYQAADNRLDIHKQSIRYATFFDHVLFQVMLSINSIFCHSIQRQKTTVHELIEQAERYHRAPMSCVIGYDSIPTCHSHMVIACRKQLDRYWFHRYLKVTFVADEVEHSSHKAYDVRDFDWKRNGLRYVLDVCNRFDKESVDWEFWRMNYYFPEAATSCWDRKKIRRHQAKSALQSDKRPWSFQDHAF